MLLARQLNAYFEFLSACSVRKFNFNEYLFRFLVITQLRFAILLRIFVLLRTFSCCHEIFLLAT